MSLQRRKSVIIINSFRFNIFFSYWSFFDSLYDKRTFSNEESHELQSILRMNMITKNNPKSCSTSLKCLPSPDDYGIFLCHKKTSKAFLRCGARQKNYLQLKTFNRLKSIKKVKASTKPIGITPTFKVCRKKPTSYFVNISFAWGLPQIKMSFYGFW